MPVYNRAWIVAEAIESVLALELAEWELVLVDDGSTDTTPQILAAYAAREPVRLKVIAHPGRENRGIAASRNLGVARCTGRYLAFLDSDDIYAPLRFRWAIHWLEGHSLSSGCVEPYRIEQLDAATSARDIPHLTTIAQANFGWLRAMLFNSVYWNMPVITLRRSSFAQYGGFDEEMRVGEEVRLWLTLAIAEVIGVAQSAVPVATIRRHSNHSWQDATPDVDRRTYLGVLIKTIRTHGGCDVKLTSQRRFLETKLRTYLIETLGDSRLTRSSRVGMWLRSVASMPRLVADWHITSNVTRVLLAVRVRQ